MTDARDGDLTADQQIRSTAAKAAATLYGPFAAEMAKSPDDLYRNKPQLMADDALRLARLIEQYIRDGRYDGDSLV